MYMYIHAVPIRTYVHTCMYYLLCMMNINIMCVCTYEVTLFYMPLAKHLVMLRVYWMIHGRLQTIQCIMDSILQRFDYTFLYIYILHSFS